MRSMMAFVALSTFIGTTASAALITFDDLGLAHGQIMSNQAPGVTISGVNPAQSFNHVALFDTTVTGTSDPDLEDPWSGGNMASSTVFGNILILAENDDGAGDGVLDDPDDQAGNHGQYFRFEFDQDIEEFGFDLIDVEGSGENGMIEFYDDTSLIASLSFSDFLAGGLLANASDPVVFGNNFANHIAPMTSSLMGQTFDEVRIRLAGSAGVDNLYFQPVPAPGALALLAGLMLPCRRRHR